MSNTPEKPKNTIHGISFCFLFFPSQTTVVLENKLAERAFGKAGAL
jgi:hypothetical protein